MAGEFEMEALAAGAIRVLSGEEEAKTYTGIPVWNGFDVLMVARRVTLIYATGLLFMAFGVAFSVNSNLGVSPVNSLPYVISQIITGLDLGNCVIRVFCFLYSGSDPGYEKGFCQMDQSDAAYIFHDFWIFCGSGKMRVVGDFAIPTYPGTAGLMLAISIVYWWQSV